MPQSPLATTIGYVSLGLGVAAVGAPRAVSRAAGFSNHVWVMRTVVGARELSAGVGILSQERPAGWMWARVAGDVFDIAALSARLRSSANARNTAIALATVLVITALDVACGIQLTSASRGE